MYAWVLVWLGVGLLLVSNLLVLLTSVAEIETQIEYYAVINLIAVGMITFYLFETQCLSVLV